MSKKTVQKPWGREEILEVNHRYAMKILVVKPGKRLSLQYHEVKVETMFCLSGTGALEITDHDTGVTEEHFVTPGTFKTIWPFDIHRLRASGQEELIILEASSPELDDVKRLEDDYGRDKKEED